MGRRTFSTLAAARAALAGEAVCMPVEWTDSSTAASSSLTFSFHMCIQGTGTVILALLSCVCREGPLCFLLSSLSLLCPLLVVP